MEKGKEIQVAFIRLNDKVLKNEYCNKPKDKPCNNISCYNDSYQCPHWKQEWEYLYERHNRLKG